MIKNVIFDLGGVMVGFRHIEVIESLGYSHEKALLLKKLTIDTDVNWEADRGFITFDEKVQKMCDDSPEYESDIRKVMSHITEMFYLFDDIKGIINDIKSAGYGMYYLSNTSEEIYEDINEKYRLFEMFDGGIISYKDRVLKPEPEIFNLFLKRYALKADECVFVDDLKKNTNGAKSCGLHTITLENQSELRDKLREKGVNI